MTPDPNTKRCERCDRPINQHEARCPCEAAFIAEWSAAVADYFRPTPQQIAEADARQARTVEVILRQAKGSD